MKSKFQTGTKVRIINPEFFVRCGYPETIDSATKKFLEWCDQNGDSAKERLNKAFPFLGFNIFDSINEFDPIIRALAKEYNKKVLKFGGRERKIYTKRIEKLKGAEMVISEFKRPLIKKTGVYQPACNYKNWMAYDDYKPAELKDVKTHVFYPVYWPSKSVVGLDFIDGDEYVSWIERENLEILD
jgi:hypothetical protein